LIRFTAILIAVFATVGLGSASATPRTPSAATAAPVFSGSGDRTLPPITVSAPSTLRWTSNGPAFQVFTRTALGGSINSAAGSGATYLRAGTYQLEINAYAAWTMRIVTGVERPRSLGGGLVGFRGNGGRDLPPFSTRRGTNLIWTNNGAFFRLDSGPFSMSIKSQAKRGKRSMAAGLHEFAVNASGSWTIGWKP
jgi:hypothetical protein